MLSEGETKTADTKFVGVYGFFLIISFIFHNVYSMGIQMIFISLSFTIMKVAHLNK